MPATRGVLMILGVPGASVLGGALTGIFLIDGDAALDDGSVHDRVKMPVVQIVGMASMGKGRMAAMIPMLMRMTRMAFMAHDFSFSSQNDAG